MELKIFLDALLNELRKGQTLSAAFPPSMSFAPQSEVLSDGIESLLQLLTSAENAHVAVQQLKLTVKRNRAFAMLSIAVLYSRFYPKTFPALLEELSQEIKFAYGGS